MARRGMTGQLNMFDFFSSLDNTVPGEVEMVSLVPSFEEENHPEGKSASAVMSRSYEVDGRKIEIAYLNYNKVRIQDDDGEPNIIEFSTTKEAVDYYVERMQEFEKDE